MWGDDWMNLAYLVLLLIAVGGFLVVEFRARPGSTLRQALAWGLIFVGALAAAGLWQQVSQTVAPRPVITGDRIEVPMGNDGHYHLPVRVNGTEISFVVDTGASTLALGRRDARRVGIDPDTLGYIGQARTANGITRTAPVTLGLVEIGDIRDTDVPAVVIEGELSGSLMGMSYLRRFARISLEADRLVLER